MEKSTGHVLQTQFYIWHLFIYLFITYSVCVYMCTRVHVMTHLWSSEDTLWECIFFFDGVGSRDQTQSN